MFQYGISILEAKIYQSKWKWLSGENCKVQSYATRFNSLQNLFFIKIYQSKWKWLSGENCKVQSYGTRFDSLQNLFFHKIYSDPPKRAGLGLGQTLQDLYILRYGCFSIFPSPLARKGFQAWVPQYFLSFLIVPLNHTLEQFFVFMLSIHYQSFLPQSCEPNIVSKSINFLRNDI